MSVGAETWKHLERAEMDRHGVGRVWSDWLDICVLTLQSLTDNVGRGQFNPFQFDGLLEDAVRAKTRPYSAGTYPNRPYDHLARAFGALQEETEATGVDVLGALFMEHVAHHGWQGQFFTPEPVCEMLARMTIGDDVPDGARVMDPACGSGRMLLAAATINRTFDCYGVDIDHNCCLMTVLNLAMRGLKGHVTEGNSLSLELRREWDVRGAFVTGRAIVQAERPALPPAVVQLPVRKGRPAPPLFDLLADTGTEG